MGVEKYYKGFLNIREHVLRKMARINQQTINQVVSISGEATKFKKLDIVLLISIIVLEAIQFILPVAEKDGTNISSFQALRYNVDYWAFNYFYFISLIVIGGLVLWFLSKKKRVSNWFGFTLWAIAFIGLLTFMFVLQEFIKRTLSLGIQFNAQNLAGSFLIIGIGALIAAGRLFNDYEKIAEIIKRNMITPDFKNAIKNKEIFYDNTVLLNPKWGATLTQPAPLKMVVTDKEIVVSSTPITKILLSNIKKVRFNKLYQIALRIICKDDKTYKIMWAPLNKTIPYSVLETENIKDNLIGILKKKGFL